MFTGKTIVLGVTACNNAYQAADIAKAFVKQGASVEVILTPNATEFVAPLTFRNITQNPVVSDTFGTPASAEFRKGKVSGRADAVVVAPASADFIARAAGGLADNVLLTTLLSVTVPVFFFPQMNPHMYAHPATKRNFAQLREYGYRICEGDGTDSQGHPRPSNMLSVEKLVQRVAEGLGLGR